MLRRVLKLVEDDKVSDVVVTISYPEARGEEYSCTAEIHGAGFNIDNRIRGVDSMQATILALKYVRSIITNHQAYKTGKLYWLEPGNELDPL